MVGLLMVVGSCGWLKYDGTILDPCSHSVESAFLLQR